MSSRLLVLAALLIMSPIAVVIAIVTELHSNIQIASFVLGGDTYRQAGAKVCRIRIKQLQKTLEMTDV